jgi:hypothetical protein
LPRDEAEFDAGATRKLAEALKRRGVADDVLQDALAEIQKASRPAARRYSKSDSICIGHRSAGAARCGDY